MTTTVFQRIGPFEILKEIGRGGMAVVFLADDTRTSRQVALKLVPAGTDREAREIVEAEQWGAKLQEQFCAVSPHVPTVYEYDNQWGYFYIAMEYLDGENLSEAIGRGAMEVERAATIAIELCRFLEAAHSFEATIGSRKLRSLLHGDLKPRNVRITSSNQIKVLDFGIAKALSLSRKVTRNDFGSIAYLSPERLESGDIDAYADFWAVGVLLYEMVSGVPPFWAQDTRRLEQRIRSRRPPQPLADSCPIGLQAVVAKLLAPSPAERYDSAKAILDDLERVRSGAETDAAHQGWPAHASDEPPTRRTRPLLETDDETTRRTSKGADGQSAASAQPAGHLGDEVETPRVAEGARGGSGLGAPSPSVGRSRWQRFRAALLVAALLLVLNEIWVAVLAGRVMAAVPTQELAGLPEVWGRHERLARRSYLGGIGVAGLERALTRQTLDLAGRVMANYRTPVPAVREAQWKAARDGLARAVAATPNNPQLRAALRYCDGHLSRINGEARKARRQVAAAQREFSDALTAFREAAELRPSWPDPFLGLARTFIYGLEDVDRGSDALTQAQRLGHALGARETTQLADGYRARAETLVRTAGKLSGIPQEHDYLTRAAEAYRQALTLYATVVDFADVTGNIRIAQRGLEQVEERLAELSPSKSQQGALQDRSSLGPTPSTSLAAPLGKARPWA